MKTVIIMFCFLFMTKNLLSAEISFTIDEPQVLETPLLTHVERNERILKAFKDHNITGTIFVCGMRVDHKEGEAILKAWDEGNHMISNHSYSHKNYNKEEVSFKEYSEDFLKVKPMIKKYKNFSAYYRFPFLKEGQTSEKRDQMREFLKKHNYRHGHVTIDASDWFIDMKLREKLAKDPKADVSAYRDYYLSHLWERAQFYNDLSKKVYGREIKHTVLIHHNLLNALFLGDVMNMFKEKGWKLISAREAFSDKAFLDLPANTPAGEGLLWAKARESGKFESLLRYPAEDSRYEEEKMKQLGL